MRPSVGKATRTLKPPDQLGSSQFFELFPDDESAVNWFESVRWPDGRYCPHCGSLDTAAVKSQKPQPYRCRDCRRHFTATVGTVMQSRKLPVRKWLHAMYLMSINKKGLSSLQLARELNIGQEAAWRLGYKIRRAWNRRALFPMGREVDVDETYIVSRESNKRTSKSNRDQRTLVMAETCASPVGRRLTSGGMVDGDAA